MTEIVQKFLTKEQTYAQLLKAVSENERRLDTLRRETEEKRDILHALKIDQNGGAFTTSAHLKSAGVQEIQELNQEIEVLEREKTQIDERRKKINLVADKVNGWGNRVNNKLNAQFNGADPAAMSNKKMSILSLFNSITEMVCS